MKLIIVVIIILQCPVLIEGHAAPRTQAILTSVAVNEAATPGARLVERLQQLMQIATDIQWSERYASRCIR